MQEKSNNQKVVMRTEVEEERVGCFDDESQVSEETNGHKASYDSVKNRFKL
jgi:hypothetical protein